MSHISHICNLISHHGYITHKMTTSYNVTSLFLTFILSVATLWIEILQCDFKSYNKHTIHIVTLHLTMWLFLI